MPKNQKLTLLLTTSQRAQIETVRHQLEQRGRKASLSAVALIEQAMHQPIRAALISSESGRRRKRRG
jgi:hypothetical protein